MLALQINSDASQRPESINRAILHHAKIVSKVPRREAVMPFALPCGRAPQTTKVQEADRPAASSGHLDEGPGLVVALGLMLLGALTASFWWIVAIAFVF